MEKNMTIERNIVVAKIGGELQVTPEGFRVAIGYMSNNPDIHFLVTSAFGGNPKVTNLLIACSPEPGKSHPFYEDYHKVYETYNSPKEVFDEIYRRHISIGDNLGYYEFPRLLNQVASIIDSASKTDSESEKERFRHHIISRGEWLSGHMWAELLGWRFVNPTELIRFRRDDRFDKRSYGSIKSRLKGEDRFVIPGFYGLGADGTIRLFPRNGSDLTAAYIACGISASEYQNLKGVDGVLSANPNIVGKRNAILIPKLTYWENEELAYGGFQVLHQDATAPVAIAGIPLRVLNPTRSQSNPNYKGTLIVADREIARGESVIGIAGMNGFAILKISKEGMEYDRGIERRILHIFERNKVSISHTPTEHTSVSIIYDERQLPEDRMDKIREEIAREIRPTETTLYRNIGILSAVGLGLMENGSEASAKLSAALNSASIRRYGIIYMFGDISVRVFIEDSSRLDEAIKIAHKTLIEDYNTPNYLRRFFNFLLEKTGLNK